MSNPLYQRHVISIADLTRHDLETVIAKYPDSQAAQTARQRLKGK